MGKILRLFVLLGILSLTMSACSTDGDSTFDKRYRTFGRIEAVDGSIEKGFDIRLDDGSWLILNNSHSFRGLSDGDRIYFYYTVLGEIEPLEGYKRFFAVLTGATKILSKEPVLQSFINEDYEHRQDSIGFDPIRVEAAGFGGRYLNVRFSVPRKINTNELHFINLVADDVDSEGVLNVYMRHNGFDDVPVAGSKNFQYSSSVASFDITGLIPEGEEGVKIRLIWNRYASTNWSDTIEDSHYMGLFVPYGGSDDEVSPDDLNSGQGMDSNMK